MSRLQLSFGTTPFRNCFQKLVARSSLQFVIMCPQPQRQNQHKVNSLTPKRGIDRKTGQF
eukprot:123346-Amphidinium_carterae.1